MKEFLKKFIDMETLKFLISGVINTIVGAGVMFLLYNFTPAGYWLSSVCNYVVGCIVSYFLNKYWTFQNSEHSFKIVLKFVLTVAVCYLIAYGCAKPLVSLILSGASVKVRDNLAMLTGMVFYTVLNYFGQRFFAFKKEKVEEGKEN